MKKLINDPADVVSEALLGIEAAHPSLRVDHANKVILRGDAPVAGKVGMISGGAPATSRCTAGSFPMVSHVGELLAARRLLDEVGRPASDGFEVGMMIEVPAAALKAAAFIPHVDFVSIGTNDLTQYALAAERGNEAVAAAADPLDPGVLRLVDAVCRAATGSGVRVAVCGEVAADPTAVPLLLGLGVDELSVGPYSVPTIKQSMRGLSMSGCRELARRALSLPSAEQVRALVD